MAQQRFTYGQSSLLEIETGYLLFLLPHTPRTRDAQRLRIVAKKLIKNPFFKCIPGEKYMDECDSCRCTDGHGGWCTNQYCEFRSLYQYAMKLSDGEFY